MRFTLLLLVASVVAASITNANAKTTDELINDVEDLLNKAPRGRENCCPGRTGAESKADGAASGRRAAGGMRFQQVQAQQAPGQGAVPNSPFGVQVNPGQAASAYASLQGSQCSNAVMNRGGVPARDA